MIEFAAADGSRRWALKFGAQKINLHQAGASFVPHAAFPSLGTADLCFVSPPPLGDWHNYLTARSVEVIDDSVARSGVQGSMQSLYIRDPDGNLLEISNLV